MSKERKQGSVFRTSKHAKDILADATYTIEKFESLHHNQQRLHLSDIKKKLGDNVKSIYGENRTGKVGKSVKILESKLESPSTSYSQDFYKRLKGRKDLEMSKLNTRIEQLKKRILPGEIEEGEKLEKKLNEIIDINNKNSKKQLKDAPFFSQHSSPSSISKKQKLQEADYRQVQSQFWNRLSKESKLSKSTIDIIRSNRIDILMRKTMDSQEELQALNRLNPSFLRKTEKLLKDRNSDASFSKMESHQEDHRNNRFITSSNSIYVHQTPRSAMRNSIYHKSHQLDQWQMIRYLKEKQKRKNFINSISKELIEGEKAVKIYSFVKGGYPIDKPEVEGQFLSLTRFNEARNEFATLNWMYKTVQDDVSSKNIKNEEPEKENNSHSFKRLVQINQLAEKLPRTHLQKLMKTSKIVT